jgi:hypothetical protein
MGNLNDSFPAGLNIAIINWIILYEIFLVLKMDNFPKEITFIKSQGIKI